MRPRRPSSSLRWISRLAVASALVASSESAPSRTGDDDGAIVVNLRGSVGGGPVAPPPTEPADVVDVTDHDHEQSRQRSRRDLQLDNGTTSSIAASIVSSVVSSVLPSSVGDEPTVQHRIIGGTAVTDWSEVPYMVGLFKGGVHWCGGAVIAADYIVTAGHCGDIDSIRLGSLDKTERSPEKGNPVTSNANVVEFDDNDFTMIRHDGYRLQGYLHDCMLIRLNKPLDIAKFVPIAINDSSDFPYDGERLKTMGWGSKDDGTKPNTLREVSIIQVNQEACKRAFSGEYIDSDMMCAIASGKDACQGDSGGPLVVPATADGAPVKLVGLVSWGYGCNSGHPGVYHRVSDSFTWIRDELCADSVSPPGWTGCARAALPVVEGSLKATAPPTPAPTPALDTGTATDSQIKFEFKFDAKPSDIGWEVKCGLGKNKPTLAVVKPGSYLDNLYGEKESNPDQAYQTFVTVPAGTMGNCRVILTDVFGDGLCVSKSNCSKHYIRVFHVVGGVETLRGQVGSPGELDPSDAYFSKEVVFVPL